VSDENTIRNTVARYCLLADAKKFGELAGLFAEDGVLRFKGTEMAKGSAALEKVFVVSEVPPGNHMTVNVVVDVEGNKAGMQCNFFYITLEKAIISVGLYQAAFVKVGSDWKIQSWDVDFW
jgi:hypothetical protein